MTDVKVIAAWTGWCDECETDRPLMLTQTGPRGLFAWLRGVSWEDRELGLYCRVCGEHQVVALHEEDDPVVVGSPLLTALTRVGLCTVTLARAAVPFPPASAPAGTPARRAVAVVPVQRVVQARPGIASVALPDSETALDLAAAGLVA